MKIVSGLGRSGRIPEGADVRLQCLADANPRSSLSYTWVVNNEEVREHGTELVLRNVTRDQHDAIVRCRARNAVGESEAFETLEVSCKLISVALRKVFALADSKFVTLL